MSPVCIFILSAMKENLRMRWELGIGNTDLDEREMSELVRKVFLEEMTWKKILKEWAKIIRVRSRSKSLQNNLHENSVTGMRLQLWNNWNGNQDGRTLMNQGQRSRGVPGEGDRSNWNRAGGPLASGNRISFTVQREAILVLNRWVIGLYLHFKKFTLALERSPSWSRFPKVKWGFKDPLGSEEKIIRIPIFLI